MHLHSVVPANHNTPDELVMGERKELTALNRIEQFNDNKTEQVWELFKNDFRNASRQLDGELGWMLVSGGLSIEDINKQMPKEIVAKLVADVAMSASSAVPFAASWISNADQTGGQLTDAGVLPVPRPGARQCAPPCASAGATRQGPAWGPVGPAVAVAKTV